MFHELSFIMISTCFNNGRLLIIGISVLFCVCLFMQRGDWPMHKLECVAMCAYGENWCPSETVRLVARLIMKQVKYREVGVESKQKVNEEKAG